MATATELIKELRDATGAGFLDCKRALAESQNDLERAGALLRQWGAASAEKRGGRETPQGTVVSYVHVNNGIGRVGALVELNCESDFVARTDQFQQLAQRIAQHIVEAGPEYVTEEQVPVDLDTATRAQALKERVLMKQRFQETDQTIEELIKAAIGTLGENIRVSRFCRFVLGGD
jgi:elongation factor Ts